MCIQLGRADGAPPIYSQLAGLLRQRIMAGELAPGTKLPRELDLAQQFGVSRIPVRQALATLQREGLIRREHGRGTFVADSVDRPEVLRLTGVVGLSIAKGTVHRLISVETVAPHGEVARFFDLPPGGRLMRFLRSRTREGTLFNHIVNYLPVPVGERMRGANLQSQTMINLLSKRLRIRIGAVRQIIQASTADPVLARQLGIETGAPVLYVETRIRRKSGEPVMFAQTYYRGDRSSYSIEVPG